MTRTEQYWMLKIKGFLFFSTAAAGVEQEALKCQATAGGLCQISSAAPCGGEFMSIRVLILVITQRAKGHPPFLIGN